VATLSYADKKAVKNFIENQYVAIGAYKKDL
jgi:hypothetical protein